MILYDGHRLGSSVSLQELLQSCNTLKLKPSEALLGEDLIPYIKLSNKYVLSQFKSSRLTYQVDEDKFKELSVRVTQQDFDSVLVFYQTNTVKQAKKDAKKRQSGLKGKRYVTTGELALFREVWNERKHMSEVSGKPLVDTDDRFWISQFSHILPKGLYPEFRLLKENIVLQTALEHKAWGTKQYTLVDDTDWAWVFEKEEELRIRANHREPYINIAPQ